MDDVAFAAVARALGHPARVRLMRVLASQDACTGVDVFGSLPLAQSTVSQHLAVLKRAGLVHTTPLGNRTVYCINERPLVELAAVLRDLADARPECGKEGDVG